MTIFINPKLQPTTQTEYHAEMYNKYRTLYEAHRRALGLPIHELYFSMSQAVDRYKYYCTKHKLI